MSVWRAVAANPNTAIFLVGLLVLCGSVAVWSVPAAGVVCGGSLITVAVWPFVRKG